MKKAFVLSFLIGVLTAANLSAQITGATISGSLNVNSTLTPAIVGSITPGNTIQYEWFYSDNTSRGISATYLIVAADQGKQIYVKASEYNGATLVSGPASSSNTAAVNSFPVASNVIILGDPKSGLTLYGSYTFSDADGDLQGATTFKWFTATDEFGAGKSPIGGATSQTYKLTDTELGKYIGFSATPVASGGSLQGNEVTTSTYVGLVTNTKPSASNITITGASQVGTVLVAGYTYSDPEGDLESGSTYQWLVSDAADGNPHSDIALATSRTFKLTNGQIGKYIGFKVTPGAATGTTPGDAVTGTVWIGQITNSKPVASNITINGTAQVGSVLVAGYTYSDSDGDLESGSQFQWLVSNAADGNPHSDIALATSSSFKLTNNQIGKYVGFKVIPGAAGGTTPGDAVTGTIWIGPVSNTPPVSTTPTITYTSLNVGGILTGHYTYSDAEGDLESGTTFQWYSSATSGGSYSQISGETAINHVIGMSEQGMFFKIYITPKAATGAVTGAEVQSTYAGPANSKPVASGVNITGTVDVGQTLTGHYSFSDPDPADVQGTSKFQWFRDNVAIPGETGLTYLITSDDEGSKFKFQVTPVSSTGFPDTGTAVTSAETTSVPLNPSLPVVDELCLDGKRKSGEIITGKYHYYNTSSDDHFQYRWMRGADTIPGATSLTYTMQAADIDSAIYLVVYPFSHSSAHKRGATVKSAALARHTVFKASYYNTERDTILTGDPSGGTFSGPGVTAGIFKPSTLDYTLSPFTVKYQVVITNTHNSCVQEHSKSIEVKLLNMHFEGWDPVYCSNGENDTIIVKNIPTGYNTFYWYYSVAGLVVKDLGDTVIIDPKKLTHGDYWDYLEFVCSDGSYYRYIYDYFKVDATPTAAITNLSVNQVFCKNTPDFELFGYPSNGVFSGAALKGNYFSPELSNLNENVTYKITTARGCKSSVTVPVIVNPIPDLQFVVADSCITSDIDSTEFNNITVGKNIVSKWKWEFLDISRTDTLENPKSLYKTSGIHKVILNATTNKDCYVSLTQNIDLGVKPKADFYWQNECFHSGTGDLLKLKDTTISLSPVASRTWIFPGGDVKNVGAGVLSYDYPKAAAGYMPVSYIVRTTYRNCHDTTTINVYVRPTVSLASADYSQDFQNGKGGWVKDYETVNNWTFGIANRTTIKSAPDSVWYTKYTLSKPDTLQVKEHSSIISPCFDFTSIKRPMVILKLWKRFDYTRDGAVLQYRIKDEKEWNLVGSLDDGINWFNSPLIKGEPGGKQLGWTSPVNKMDAGWSDSKHYLDELVNKKDVKFRLAYGTDGSSENNDGIALNSIDIGRRKRIVMLEHFTNTTSVAGSTTTEIISDLARTKSTDVINIQYHTNFPGTDPYFNDNPADASARLLFYGLSKVPYSIIDGGTKINYARLIDYNLVEKIDSNDLTRRSLIDPLFDITLNKPTVSNNILTVGGSIRALKDTTVTNATLYIAVTQKVSTQATGALGETVFYNVFRKFIPDAGGINLAKTWTKGTPYAVTDRGWTIEKIPNHAKIEVIAFIQNNITKEIYQAVSDTVSITVGVNKLEAVKGEGFYLYPNPAYNRLTVEFENALKGDATISVYDFTGVIIKTFKAGYGQKEFVIENLGIKPGIYLVRIMAGGLDLGYKKLVVSGQ